MDPKNIEEILIYDNRAVVSYDLGEICRFDCVYCYKNEDISITQTADLKKVFLKLKDVKDMYEVITAGCEQELFMKPNEALNFLNIMKELGKIMSFATKAVIPENIAGEIGIINKELIKNGAYVVGEVSFATGVTDFELESKVPSVEKRIKTLERLNGNGIHAVPFIRPILPDEIVPFQNICSLIDSTVDICEVYAMGDFYFNQSIAERMRLGSLDNSFWGIVQKDVDAPFLNEEIGEIYGTNM